MKNFIRGNKLLAVAFLVASTSFAALLSIFNYNLVTVDYNNNLQTLRVAKWVDDNDLLGIANIDTSVSAVTSKTLNSFGYTLSVADTFLVTITVDGQTKTISTTPKTLSQILDDCEITLKESDFANLSLDTVITKSEDISVTRVTKKVVDEVVLGSYNTIKRSNSDLEFGKTKTISKGEKSQTLVTKEITMYDGVEHSSNVISEKVLKPAVNEVIEYGAYSVSRSIINRENLITTSAGNKLTYSKVINVQASAYTTEGQVNKKTASGKTAKVGLIAVDTNVIPMGTKLYITSADGKSWVYGTAVAADTGGSIKGNKIDLYFNTKAECIKFGRQNAKVYVLS